jgi:hypothetical protein
MATRILVISVLPLALLGGASAGAALAGPDPVAPVAASTVPRDQVVLSGTVTVPRGKEAGEIVVLEGSATVAGLALGDVIVLDGPVTVTGQVSGSVVAVTGDVRLGRGAQVGGSVLAGGSVEAAPGARVSGEVREGVRFTLRGWLAAVAPFLSWLALAVSLLLVGLVLLGLAPRGLEAVHRAASRSPWAAAGWGLLWLVALPLSGALLVLSVLGLPLGLALLFGLALLSFAGMALAAWTVGRALWRSERRRWPAVLLGWLLASLAIGVPYLGPVLWAGGSAFGLGAATVAAWRARGHGGRHRAGRVEPERGPETAELPRPPAPETPPATAPVPPLEGERGL